MVVRRIFQCLAVISAIIFGLSSLSNAQEPVSWSIGTRDGSYAEFGLAGRYKDYAHDFPGGAMFEVGKGDPAKNWIYIQPGPTDKSWAGEGEHPFEVVFDLNAVPSGPHLLQIHLVDVNPADPPTLRVRVNDTIRSFQLEPGKSEDALSDPAKGRAQSVLMYVAGGFLHKGRNVINLTITKGSWLLYDCVSLTPCERAPHTVEDISLRPTYLFKNTKDGLRQIVYGSFDLFTEHTAIRTELASEAGWRVRQDFPDLPSGRHDLEIMIPPVAAQQKGHLKIFAGGGVSEQDVTIYPQKQWKIYLAPSAHFDYGYTAVQDKTLEVHRGNVERAIDWCAKYPDFGWNLESSFLAEDYLKNGTHQRDFLDLAKKGRIGVMGLYTNELTGICSGEGLSRSADYYDFLKHTYGIESKCAMENDVPSMVGTVPMVLSGHGIKYMSIGTNWVRGGPGVAEMVRNPFYWESPDGSRVLMYWSGGIYFESLEVCGFDDNGSDDTGATLGRVNKVIDSYLSRKEHSFDAVYLHGAYCDNVANDDTLARVPDKWNREYAYPKVIFCRGTEYLEYVEKHFPEKIKTFKGDGGVYWEDGAGSSARETALVRNTEQRLITAEKLAALCSPGFQAQTKGKFSQAWKNALLYDEHTWGAGCSVDKPEDQKTLEQWVVKKSFADKADRLSKEVLQASLQKFCAGVSVKQDSVVVFNPSSWPRSGLVTFKDSKGVSRTLRADSVPALGYKVIPLAKCAPESMMPVPGDTLDNRYYTLKFDSATGAVSSIYDKELKRELVDQKQAYKLNQYCYVAGGSKTSWGAPGGDKLSINVPENPKLAKLNMPGKQVMRITCTAPNTRSFTSEVVLYENEKRIDFINTMDKIQTYDKEGVYFAFPFALASPDVRLEIPNGVIRPEQDQLPGACKNWYCVQDFATLSDGKTAITLSAADSPLITLQDINRGKWIDHLKIENGNVFAYVMNNYWFTNYKAGQGGPFTFRFSITSSKTANDTDAKRFGESVNVPMLCGLVRGVPTAKNNTQTRSFVRVAGSGIVLQALKPARFTNGTIIRLREMSGKNTTAKLSIAGITYKRAFLCNLAEDKLQPLVVKNGTVEVPCRKLGLVSVLLER